MFQRQMALTTAHIDN